MDTLKHLNNLPHNYSGADQIDSVGSRVIYDYRQKYQSITSAKERLIQFDINHKEQEFRAMEDWKQVILSMYGTEDLNRIFYGLEDLHYHDVHYSLTQAVWRLDIIRYLGELHHYTTQESEAEMITHGVYPLFPADLYSIQPVQANSDIKIPRVEYLLAEKDLLVEYYYLTDRDMLEKH